MAKLIPLSTTGKKHGGKYFAQVDDEDYERLCQWSWNPDVRRGKNGVCVYATSSQKIGGIKIGLKMHRMVLGLTDPNILCDHIDGNGLNNQKSNLRICNSSQNMKNRSAAGASKYLGVSRSGKKWMAMIQNKKVTHYLGLHKTEEKAALAYNEAAKKFHGEFARLNVIPDTKLKGE